MINKEDYKKALEIVQTYKEEQNTKFVTDRTCCICKTNIISALELKHTYPLKQEQGMWNNGVVEKITFGYGSRHDMDSFYIAVCDDCIEELEANRLATNIRELIKQMKDE